MASIDASIINLTAPYVVSHSPSDNRQAIRARLFKMWFAKSSLGNKFSLTTYHSVDNEVEYFYGLILKKNNPHHNQLIDIFMDFISDY